MHGKVAPPFTDWWYRLTPGTMKYCAPFMPCLGNTRNLLDVLVEGVLTYIIAFYILFQPQVTCKMMMLLFACSVYEFLFDYGQHLSTYGTQLMYVFACMCVPVEQGQLVGIQLFLTWFYFCSGWCKIGPWFKYLNVANLMTAKFMVNTPWAGLYRRLMYKDRDNGDYNLTCLAGVFSMACAMLETLGPLLCLFSGRHDLVLAGIFVFMCMHIYIIATLIVDVFTWNLLMRSITASCLEFSAQDSTGVCLDVCTHYLQHSWERTLCMPSMAILFQATCHTSWRIDTRQGTSSREC